MLKISSAISRLVASMSVCAILSIAAPVSADTDALSGSWALDETHSQALEDQIKDLRQEERDFKTEHGGINDPEKPKPFEGRKFGDKEWESRRVGLVANASVNVTTMVESETIKLYFSERVIVSYDGELRRRLNPNPAGRVYSATGRGVSKDAIGETLAYLEDGAFVIETRTTSAERLIERFELSEPDEMKVTIRLKNPDWRREVEFIRYFTRN